MADFLPAFQISFILEESTNQVLLHSVPCLCVHPKSFSSGPAGNGGACWGWTLPGCSQGNHNKVDSF